MLTTTEQPPQTAPTIVGLQPLSEIKADLIRLCIQGPPGSGKSFAAATFPNPIFIDLDNKLRGLKDRSGIGRIPFCDVDFVNTYNKGIYKAKGAALPPNRKDAIKHWLRIEGAKLTSEQTLVLDSWTSLQNYVDQQHIAEPIYNVKGEVDNFKFWGRKLEYAIEIVEILKGLKCNVVVTCHETIDRDEDDIPTGKLRPLMAGSFKDQMAGQFTDVYRQHAIEKFNEKTKQPNLVNGKPLEKEVEWFWQIRTDSLFTACCSLKLKRDIKFIPADYKSLIAEVVTT